MMVILKSRVEKYASVWHTFHFHVWVCFGDLTNLGEVVINLSMHLFGLERFGSA